MSKKFVEKPKEETALYRRLVACDVIDLGHSLEVVSRNHGSLPILFIRTWVAEELRRRSNVNEMSLDSIKENIDTSSQTVVQAGNFKCNN